MGACAIGVPDALRALLSWRALEAVGAVASAVAAGGLTHVEVTKHDYERNKTSFDVLWRSMNGRRSRETLAHVLAL